MGEFCRSAGPFFFFSSVLCCRRPCPWRARARLGGDPGSSPLLLRRVRAGVRLSLHDGEFGGLASGHQAVLELTSVAAHATLRRISQYVDAIDVFHVWTTFGCHHMSNLSTDCARS